MSASSLPDTAVQLFEVTPSTEVSPASEVSFFDTTPVSASESMEITPTPEVSLSPEIAFFDGPVATPESITFVETVTVPDSAISFAGEPVVESFEESMVTAPVATEVVESVQEVVIEEPTVMFMSTPAEVPQTPAAIPEKNDILAPIHRAIAEYDTILVAHTRIAESKDMEIAEYNNQVAVAKAAAKKTLEERKVLETEMDRVRQMKELFSAQLK